MSYRDAAERDREAIPCCRASDREKTALRDGCPRTGTMARARPGQPSEG